MMNSKTVLSAVMAACMSLSGLAMAQQDKDVRSDEANRREQMRREPGADHHERDRRPVPQRHESNRGRGAGPDHNFYRGGRLPQQSRGYQYVVEDWRGHHLTQPPRGYHWVQTGADYVLVAVATGVIASILLNP